jgi:VWFA-related protein
MVGERMPPFRRCRPIPGARPALLVHLLASVATIGLAAQPPAAPPDQRPAVTFRTEINFVEIDAVVTDGEGRFVAGLTKDDFEVIEQGAPQPIATFSLVHIPVVRTASVADGGRRAVEPDTASNRQPFDGRVFLLLLDDLQTDRARTAHVRRAAQEFVSRHVASNDLAAIAFTSGAASGQDFTSSRPRLLAAIDRFGGVKLPSRTIATIRAVEMGEVAEIKYDMGRMIPPKDPHEDERTLRAKASLESLTQMSRFLGGIRGRRKALIYVGEGIDHELVDPVIIDQPAVRDTAGVREAMRNAVAEATRANVSVYTIDPRGLSTSDEAITVRTVTMDPTTPLSTMRLVDEVARSHLWLRSVSEETGGIPFLNTNDTTGPFGRIVDDSSSYYILGYYAPPGRKDGGFRRVDVRVTRPGLQVRARQGYYAPSSGAPSKGDAQAAGKGSSKLRDALRSPLPVSGLTLAASAAPFQGKDSFASISVVVEVGPAGLAFSTSTGTTATDVELHLAATDPASTTPASATYHVAKLRLRGDTLARVTQEGIRITRRLELRPGRYRVQIGARDTTSGAVGTLFADLDVPDLFAPPLALSGVLLVSAGATRIPTVEPDPALGPLLPGAHTARREFASNDTIAVFAEVYDNDLSMPHRVRVRTTVLDSDGNEVFAADAEHGSEELRAGASAGTRGGFGHQVTIRASALRPGPHVLRVEAVRLSSNDRPVVREVPFTITP